MTDHAALQASINKHISEEAIPAIKEFIEIPNLSRAYDPEWDKNGLMQKACNLVIDYSKKLAIKGLELKLIEEEGKTPMVFGVVAPTKAENPKNIMFYGHIDKQPHLTEGWREGLHPTKAIEENGILFGRGGADDGYNPFTVLSTIKVLQDAGIAHDRYVLFFETDEESSSRDIMYWVEKFKDEIKVPDMMFCLDSTALNNKYFTITSTLRGCMVFDLEVQVLEKGVHSGMASGIVPSSFRVARNLLDRIEDSKTGRLIDCLQGDIPSDKITQAKETGKLQDESMWKCFPVFPTSRPASEDLTTAYIANVLEPQIEVIGQTGIPPAEGSGNVLRDSTCLRISMRLAPTSDNEDIFAKVKEVLEKDPPHGAKVTVSKFRGGNGWSSNAFPEDLQKIVETHCQTVFKTPVCFLGCGGSIPFIGSLQERFPTTLLFVSGVLLPDGNAHGPNENLDLEYLKKFSQVLVSFLADYAK